MLSPLKVPDSIETRPLELKTPKMMERSEGRNEWRREWEEGRRGIGDL